MMKYILILYMTGSSIFALPKEYPTLRQCEYAGRTWDRNFKCIPAPCAEHVDSAAYKECNP